MRIFRLFFMVSDEQVKDCDGQEKVILVFQATSDFEAVNLVDCLLDRLRSRRGKGSLHGLQYQIQTENAILGGGVGTNYLTLRTVIRLARRFMHAQLLSSRSKRTDRLGG